MGHEVWINPASRVEHHHGATVKRFARGFHGFLKERNSLINSYCNLRPHERTILQPLLLSLTALRASIIGGQSTESILGNKGFETLFPGGDKTTSPDFINSLKEFAKRIRLNPEDTWGPVVAISEFGRMIPQLAERSDSLERNRKLDTRQLLELMDEPFRPVLGHPREIAFIEEIEPVIRRALE